MIEDTAPSVPSTTSPRGGRARGAPGPVDLAVSRAQAALFEAQEPSGGWASEADLGPVDLAVVLVVEKYLGILSARDAAEGARMLSSFQLRDGSFPGYPFATKGTLTATATCYAALAAAGIPRTDRKLVRAWRVVERLGGERAVVDAFRARLDLAAVYLVLAGIVRVEALPRMPLAYALLPGLTQALEHRVHAGNVMMMFMLMALADKLAGGSRGLFGAATGAMARARMEAYLGAFQNPDGNWNGCGFQTLLMMVGLDALGVPPTDPRMVRARAWINGQKRHGPRGMSFAGFRAEVWVTSLALAALLESGARADDERVARAVDWLVDAQIDAPMPRANQRKPGAQRDGGWAFGNDNPTMPDSDDTAVALHALALVARTRSPRPLQRVLDRGTGWLLDMQNPDGGWAGYVWNLGRKKPGPLYLSVPPVPFEDPKAAVQFFLDPPAELSEPAVEGITGRALGALGRSGLAVGHPAVDRAIAFLKHQQCENGAWWGRWMTCYLPETAMILSGLAAVGEDLQAPYVRRAVAWLLSCQNPDGGWGETEEAYRDPRLAGQGKSMPPLTGMVLAGLCDAGEARSPAAERGAQYLVETQEPDGRWPNEGFLHAVFPPDSFYYLPLVALVAPLHGLARFRRSR